MLFIWSMGKCNSKRQHDYSKKFHFPYDTQGNAISDQMLITYQPTGRAKALSPLAGRVGTVLNRAQFKTVLSP